MAKHSSYGISGRSGASSSSRSGWSSSGTSASTSGGVSSARLHQKSGATNAFGGYTKVAKSDGTFTMRKSGK